MYKMIPAIFRKFATDLRNAPSRTPPSRALWKVQHVQNVAALVVKTARLLSLIVHVASAAGDPLTLVIVSAYIFMLTMAVAKTELCRRLGVARLGVCWLEKRTGCALSQWWKHLFPFIWSCPGLQSLSCCILSLSRWVLSRMFGCRNFLLFS